MLRPSIAAARLDPDNLDESVTLRTAKEMFGPGGSGPRRWVDVWSAGHSVLGVIAVRPVAELVEAVARDCAGARDTGIRI